MTHHRGVLIAWSATILAFLTGLLGGVVELVVLPQFAAMALAVMTVKRAEITGELRYVWLYRATVVLLLLAAGTCLVAAGSTVLLASSHDGRHIAGFFVLATVNLVIAVMAWRALVKPAPRRAALVGLAAVFAEIIAMLTDLILSAAMPGLPNADNIPIMLGASFVATWTGALVCMAALGTFDRSGTVVVPAARVVDEN